MELPKTYDKSREDEIYSRWIEKGYFRATPNPDKKPYTIMMPPPNITNQLHMGHALNNAIQDILIRVKRMQGYEALWLPGTDHAAIATETVVVKALAAEGITKESLGREKFLEKMWEWYDKYGNTIVNQLKKLGSSADWDKLRFTMDEGLSKAVLEVFVRLYEGGKIYKGERLINWCTKCQTSISDAEVEHEDKEGNLYHFKYPVGDGFISFATTRPETMLGDTAIAVHPEDARYAALVGKSATLPLMNREIPVIADSYVDPAFGTGVVKITPGHDPNDFEIGERHGLPRINILNDDGTINENGGHYQGLTTAEARTKIIEEMTSLGLYIKTEPLSHAVGEHDRCGTVIEPLLKEQWFVKMDELAKPALEAYTSGKLKFNRERFGKIYKHWLDNIRDWCISRQLWWGHRIPAYYCPDGHITVQATAPSKCATCGSTNLTQDEDVLDTWFSSALWPFSTLGWPDKTPELDYFYPGNTLVTAREIIFTWVIRMVFSGIECMGDIPFTDVFINGIVRDDQGRKMSKSLGNGIDPLDIISEYGADVLRLMLVSGNAIDNDTRFYYERLDPARNSLNKIWNATRFILMTSTTSGEQSRLQADELLAYVSRPDAQLETEDKWILSSLNTVVKDVTEKIEAHELGMATQKIIDFIKDEFCDWYVEMVKPRLYSKDETARPSQEMAQNILRHVLLTAVKLLHPVTPFITEDLFLALQNKEETIMLSAWPQHNPALDFPHAEREIENLKEAVRGVRAVRTEKQVPPAKKIAILIQPDAANTAITTAKEALGFLAGASSVETLTDVPPAGAISVVIPGATIYLPMDSLVDAEKEKSRLAKEKARLEQEIARIDGKLSNQGFMAKAPEALVNAEREKRENFVQMLAKVVGELE
ncbi:MAG: valine--tRNA ligase [Defluviitaleaceae bacterium]|nr:valine--tRNA ligase [Defluviitaleaceae bacterium]